MIFLTKRERAKIHTHTHTHHKIQKRKEKNTHKHTLTQFVAPLGRKEGKWVLLPFTYLCQSEPAAHQCTMKDG
jgi:hypothetical protein